MSDVSKFNIDGSDIDVKDNTARAGVSQNSTAISELSGNVGALSNLSTTDKTNIVSAINEVAGEVGSTLTYNNVTETIVVS